MIHTTDQFSPSPLFASYDGRAVHRLFFSVKEKVCSPYLTVDFVRPVAVNPDDTSASKTGTAEQMFSYTTHFCTMTSLSCSSTSRAESAERGSPSKMAAN